MVKTNEWLQLATAIIVTTTSFLYAWHYSQPALSSIPSLDMPGAILVGVKQGSASAPVRVDVDLRFYPSPDLTSFDMVLKGDGDAAVPSDDAGELMVGFCGAMKDVLLRRTSDGEELTFESPIPSTDTNPRVGAIGFEFSLDDDCVMTVIRPTDFRDTTLGEAGIGWAVSLKGCTHAPTEASAGSRHRYAFPRIATLTLPAAISPLDIQAVAAESVVSIEPRDLPAEYLPTVASPQVENPTAPGWSLPLHRAHPTAGFRLSGVDQQEETEVQRELFLASAAIGTAGGGLIWLFGTIGPLLNDFVQKRRNRSELVAEELVPHLGGRTDVLAPPDYLRLIAVPVLLGIAGSVFAWLISKRRR